MEQVVLITAYKEFDYLIQFVTALSDSGIISYVHIDKKTVTPEILKKINSIKHATAISEYSIPWGGIQHVLAIISLLNIALKNHMNFNYLHIVTGQDCLCRSVEEFKDFFSSDNDRNYMSISSTKSENRFRYRTFYRNDWLNYKNRWGKLATKVCYVIQRLIGINRKSPCGYQIYKGMVYVSITKEFGQYVIDYLNTEAGEKYINWLKWCFIPEEFFFQSIIMNSKYRDTVENRNYRYALWTKKHGEQPGILDENDAEEICLSKSFFARKISLKYSRALLSILGYKDFI